MLVGCVNSTDVVDVDHAGSVLVHFVKSAHNDGLSVSVHGATNGSQELVVLDQARAVEIEVTEELLSLTLGEAEHVVGHSLGEFKLVQGERVIVVHDSELLGEADYSPSATSLQLVTKALQEVLTTRSAAGWSAADVSSEDLGCELSIVEGARAILVIKVVKGVQVLLKQRTRK